MFAFARAGNLPTHFRHKSKQVNTIAMITFWSQFSSYVFNSILVLFLTRPVMQHGLGYSEGKAYVFFSLMQAMGYIMPALGGQMADKVIGLTRSILVGSLLLALAYLMVMVSGILVPSYGDTFFIAACALIPVTNSLLMGTAAGVVSKIYSDDQAKVKAGMTLYYMSINVGALLAVIIAPQLLDSPYGALSIFAVVFIGKSISALNYLWRYELYQDVASNLDKHRMDSDRLLMVIGYIVGFYLFTLYLYFHPDTAMYMIAVGAMATISLFLYKTLKLSGDARKKQLVAILLIFEAVIFFIAYNQMNTTLILFAKNNSDLSLFWFKVSPAHYQMINPTMIILLSLFLPSFYKKFTRFSIPFQFACGCILAGVGLLVMYVACVYSNHGIVSGNFFILTYALLTMAELWVSAIGLSMVGLYCCHKMLGFAMGVWLIASSLANVLSAKLAQIVALPHGSQMVAEKSLHTYQTYYFDMGALITGLGIIMWCVAVFLTRYMKRQNIQLA